MSMVDILIVKTVDGGVDMIIQCFLRILVCLRTCRKHCRFIAFSKTDGVELIGKTLVCA